MPVWDRDYARDNREGNPFDAPGFQMPQAGAKALLILHAIAAVFVLGADGQIVNWPVGMIRLSGAHHSLLGILLHPVSGGFLAIISSGLFIWLLGGMIERAYGTQLMLRQYVLGNLIAGLVFWTALALQPMPEARPLEIPAGAAAAWCFTAWRRMQFERRNVFGRDMTVGNLIGIVALIWIGLSVLMKGSQALPFVVSALIGSLSSPLSESLPTIRFKVRARPKETKPPSPKRKKAASKPAPGPDIDEILAKISREGIDALSAKEREQLDAARRARLAAEERSSSP